MMKCGFCGAENSEDALFCSRCGNALAVGEESGLGQPAGEGLPTPLSTDDRVSSGPMQGSGETPPSPPSPSTAAVPPPAPQPGISPAYPYYPGYTTPRADGLCVAGMVLGIIGLVLFWIPILAIACGILGIVLGGIGIKNVQNQPYLKTGQGMGVAGLVTGILAFVGGVVMIIIYASLTTW